MSQNLPNFHTNQAYTKETIENWIINQIALQLGINPEQIDIQQPLDSYGLDSVQAMLLVSKAEKFLGFKISPMLLWHYPTIEALAKRIAEEPEISEYDNLEI